MANDHGASTSDGKDGGTQTETGGARYTDDDMAKARHSWEKRQAKAIESARSDAVKSILNELELDSLDDLKAAIASTREVGDQKSELEKAMAKRDRDIKTLEKRLSEESSRAQSLQSKIDAAAIERTVNQAAEANNAYGDLILGVLDRQGRIGIEDGEVFIRDVRTGERADISVEAAVQQLVSDRPELARPTGRPGTGSRPPEQKHDTGHNLLTREGRIAALMELEQ